MSDGLSLLKAYSAQLMASGPRSFEVHELIDPKTNAPLVVHVFPMNAREKSLVLRPLEDSDRMGAVIQTVVNRARAKDGSALFDESDIDALLELRLGELLESIALRIGEMWRHTTVEEARGN